MTKPVEAITQAGSMVIEPNGTEVKTDESKGMRQSLVFTEGWELPDEVV